MVTLQLLGALVVLLSSVQFRKAEFSTLVTTDGARASGNLKCDFKKWNGFCDLVLAAYKHNEKAIRDLGNDIFEHNRKRLRNTNRAILEFLNLKEENKSELFEHLHIPMHRELNALSQLMVSCTDETGKELRQCGDALPTVSEATYALAQAVAEIADGTHKEGIRDACDKFKEDYSTELLNKTVFELAYKLGTTVVEAM